MMAVESPKALQDKLPRTFCKVCFTVRDNLHVKRERIGAQFILLEIYL